ncbi:MAG: ComEA family DNA-binding protein [Erysipelotrichaceae bacterium]|nr:ComEA family DNA-binding protein [Erysipelotrichaceae bacterium]
MKKVIFIIFILYLVSSSYQYVDLSKYEQDIKEVEIKGEVMFPGVYQIAWNATIEDLIDTAGGLSLYGDTSSMNLTKNIENKAVIIIPKIQEKEKISINTASKEMLMTLKGIGEKVAQRIIEHREHTPFQSLEDIMEVKGIGEKLFEKIKDDITL